jgi:UrcA family protein
MLNSNSSVAHIVTVALAAALIVMPSEFVRAAAHNVEAPSLAVQYHSTDLNTPRGVAVLYRRIRAAASSVCGSYDGVLLEEKLAWDRCVDEAVATAVARVHSERLSAISGVGSRRGSGRR